MQIALREVAYKLTAYIWAVECDFSQKGWHGNSRRVTFQREELRAPTSVLQPRSTSTELIHVVSMCPWFEIRMGLPLPLWSSSPKHIIPVKSQRGGIKQNKTLDKFQQGRVPENIRSVLLEIVKGIKSKSKKLSQPWRHEDEVLCASWTGSWTKKETFGENEDFPDGPGIKNPPANVGDAGSIPGPGRFHMWWSN